MVLKVLSAPWRYKLRAYEATYTASDYTQCGNWDRPDHSQHGQVVPLCSGDITLTLLGWFEMPAGLEAIAFRD